MALRRTSLSLRSLFSVRNYQQAYVCIIRHEQKPNSHPFSSSFLSKHQLIGSTHLSLCPVSIYHRSMSTSRVPGSEVNDVAETLSTDSVTTTVTKVGQHLIDRMHCFIELNWWISTIPTVIVFQGFLTPLFIMMKTEDIDQRNKVKFWEDPMKPSNWKKEDLQVILLSGVGLLMFGECKLLVWLISIRDVDHEKLVEG